MFFPRTPVALALLVVWVLALPAAGWSTAGSASVTRTVLRPVQNASLPFWCDWGYDWDERCYREDSDRLPIGGDTDKVWRAALRFSLATVPAGASILDASLSIHHDATCLGPRKTTRPCSPRPYSLELHPIVGDWFREREPEYGPAWGRATLYDATRPGRLDWDVTDLVSEWAAGHLANDGVLLRLVDEQEDFGVGGPKVPSASFADPALRPALEVVYAARG
jgi:hypothetical protein